MTKKKEPRSEKLLTEVELELMGILWKLGQGTVNDVMVQLPSSRKLAYTSVSTVLRILEQKEIVESRKEGRGHAYLPRVSKEAYETRSLSHLVSKVFDGAPASLVKRLIETDGLSADELKSIRSLLNERLR
jgi:predicted transcriptional regulator